MEPMIDDTENVDVRYVQYVINEILVAKRFSGNCRFLPRCGSDEVKRAGGRRKQVFPNKFVME